MLGASAGAPLEFLKLCREFGAGAWMGGTQERAVAGIGRIAWSAVTTGHESVVLFGLFDGAADLRWLNEIARIGEECVTQIHDWASE